MRVWLLASAVALAAHAQDAVKPEAAKTSAAESGPLPEYAVVSIKKNTSNDGSSWWRTDPAGMRMTNMRFDGLIRNAYGLPYVNEEQIVGAPAWVKNEAFDVEAKVDADDLARYKDLKEKQRDEMLKAMLIDRLKLKAHVETRQGPVYELVVAKGGVKMTEEKPLAKDEIPKPAPKDGVGRGGYMQNNQEVTANTIPMKTIVGMMMGQSQRVVVDKTGLTGEYSFHLKWTSEDAAANGAANGTRTEDAGGDFFSAIQEQLGLKLVPAKGPVEQIVVEHIEEPTAN